MNRYPEYAEINGKKYKINTDFRIAIECDRASRDESINGYKRALYIIYLLFGDEGLKDTQNHDKLLEMAKKYLSCGKEIEDTNEQEPDMDFVQDMDFIEASFMSDYKIDLEHTEMHWYKFFNLINGLSNSELGNCCILNNIRNLRNLDPSTIKDEKERKKVIEAQKMYSLKKEKNLQMKNKII